MYGRIEEYDGIHAYFVFTNMYALKFMIKKEWMIYYKTYRVFTRATSGHFLRSAKMFICIHPNFGAGPCWNSSHTPGCGLWRSV